jgi:hypothetical protein
MGMPSSLFSAAAGKCWLGCHNDVKKTKPILSVNFRHKMNGLVGVFGEMVPFGF